MSTLALILCLLGATICGAVLGFVAAYIYRLRREPVELAQLRRHYSQERGMRLDAQFELLQLVGAPRAVITVDLWQTEP